MSGKKTTLSVIVAAYNEEQIIEKNLKIICKELLSDSEIDWELICVNDGSTDRTGQILNELSEQEERIRVYHHQRNFGQGRAIRTGFRKSRGEILITLDADLSYGPHYIRKLIDALLENNVEIALVSPYAKGGKVIDVPLHRRFLSKYGNRYLSKMSNYNISTCTSVVRAYRREVLDTLNLNSDGMEFQVEVLMKASIMGFRVVEVPAHLQWEKSINDANSIKRVSKMPVIRNIGKYLFLGWLARPAYIFMILSIMLMIMGLYFGLNCIIIFVNGFINNISRGFVLSVSYSLRELVTTYYYGITFFSLFLLFGFLIFVFSLLLLQNKFYFEELYKFEVMSRSNLREEDIVDDYDD